MSIHKKRNLKNLMAVWPSHTIATLPWLEKHHISRMLKQKYLKSGWIQSIGSGAFIKNNDQIDWEGALYSLQTQLNFSVHVGGISSLDLLGRSHYLKFGKSSLYLFTSPSLRLPKWFLSYSWSKDLKVIHTSLGEDSSDLIEHSLNGIKILISSPERATLELLFSCPKYVGFEETDLVFENLTQLRPQIVQNLLERTHSFKIKRFFLFLAEKHAHPWMSQLDLRKIDLGKGIISLAKGGSFIKQYNLMVPTTLISTDESTIF